MARVYRAELDTGGMGSILGPGRVTGQISRSLCGSGGGVAGQPKFSEICFGLLWRSVSFVCNVESLEIVKFGMNGLGLI